MHSNYFTVADRIFGDKVNFIFRPLTSLIHIIIIPLLIAGFFYYLLRPPDFMERHKIKRALSVLIIYVVVGLLVAGFSVLRAVLAGAVMEFYRKYTQAYLITCRAD